MMSVLLALAWVLPANAGEVPDLTRDGLPNVRARAAIVVDLDSGAEIFGKNPDQVRQIASITKLYLALLVREMGIDLAAHTPITPEDRRFGRGGAKSRLDAGESFANIDLLRAMLIASDNRACTALGRAVGLDPPRLIAAMNDKARRMGLGRTEFTGPNGLSDNVSSPREVIPALSAVIADPVLAQILVEETTAISSTDRSAQIQYSNTNHALIGDRYEVLGGKTGFNDEAGYCLAIAARVDGRRVGMVFLGEEGKETRFADFARVVRWLQGGGWATAPVRARGSAATGPGASLRVPPPPLTPLLLEDL